VTNQVGASNAISELLASFSKRVLVLEAKGNSEMGYCGFRRMKRLGLFLPLPPSTPTTLDRMLVHQYRYNNINSPGTRLYIWMVKGITIGVGNLA